MMFLAFVLFVLVVWLLVKAMQPKQRPKQKSFTDQTQPDVRVINQQRQSRQIRKLATWYPDSVTIGEYNIKHALVYVGEELPSSRDRGYYGYSVDPSLIDPTLPISYGEYFDDCERIGYWPSYSNLSPERKGAYLKWLSKGRADPEACIGYVFIFFYGLERRLLVDCKELKVSSEERGKIVAEIRRLLTVYSENSSFQSYARRILFIEWLLYRRDEPLPEEIDIYDRFETTPFVYLLAREIASGQPLSFETALTWVLTYPEFYPRTPAVRCRDLLKELFRIRYVQEFGEGMLVKPNKTRLKVEYRPASSSLETVVVENFELPDPSRLKAPLKRLITIVDEATDALDSYSRYLGRGGKPDSVYGISLLPSNLLETNQKIVALSEILHRLSDDRDLIRFGNVYRLFEDTEPNPLRKRDRDALTSILNKIGIGIAPDHRFHTVKPLLDDHVLLYRDDSLREIKPTEKVKTLSLVLRLGAVISKVDGTVSEKEVKKLNSLMNDAQLTLTDTLALKAFLHWCLNTEQNTKGIKSILLSKSDEEKKAIGHFLISLAFSDGIISQEEISYLQKAYTQIGLEKNNVLRDIHSRTTTSEPVTIATKEFQESYTIPQNVLQTETDFALNSELIQKFRIESQIASKVLEEIFAEDLEKDKQDADEVAPDEQAFRLDSKDRELLELLVEQEEWNRCAIEQICNDRGLLTDGTLESLNEKSFEFADELLIEDGDQVTINIELAKEMLNAFKKE